MSLFEELITFLLSNMPDGMLAQMAQELDMSFLTIYKESDRLNKYRYISYCQNGRTIERGSFFDESFTGLEKFDFNEI